MERTVKFLLAGLLLFGSIGSSIAAEDYTMRQLTTATNVSFADCTKTYNIPAEHLYYLTIASITANRFEIKELQSKMGYALFKVNDKDFLATVAYYGDNKRLLKITPVNSTLLRALFQIFLNI